MLCNVLLDCALVPSASDPVTAGQQLHRVLDLDVRGEQQDRVRRLQPLLGVRQWSPAAQLRR
jgi:hypothetical protein